MEIEEILAGWREDNPGKVLTRSCPNFETNNSIFIYYKDTVDSKEEKVIEVSVLETTFVEAIDDKE